MCVYKCHEMLCEKPDHHASFWIQTQNGRFRYNLM